MREKKLVIDNEKLLEEWNWEKNNSLNIFPNKLACGSSKSVWWKCKKCGHEWQTKVSHKNSGTGCKKCLHNSLSTATKSNNIKGLYPDIAKSWNYKRNSILPENVYPLSNKKYWWICDFGHEWQDSAAHRVGRNAGCPYCSNHKVLEGYNDLQTTNPDLMNEWDWDKNNSLNIFPNAITKGSKKRAYWVCKKGHSWSTPIYVRTSMKCGCPQCNKELKTSFPEKIIAFYISKIFDDTIENYRSDLLNKTELDMFIPSINTAIEYDGSRWHKSIEKDLTKDNLCSKNNIRLFRVRELNCPEYDSPSRKIYVKSRDLPQLENAITQIIKIISPQSILDININRDSAEIMETVLTKEKENTIANLDIISEWNYEKNKNIDPSCISIYSNRKFWWICSKNHEWSASPAHRSKGRNCPYCSNQKILCGYNDLETLFPLIAKEWDYSKNNKSPQKVSAGSNKKYWWTCNKCGHSWQTSIYVRTYMNCGCPECSKKVISRKVSRKVRNKTTNICYNSMKEAGKSVNISPSAISMCCRGIIKHAGHYEWEYVDE